MATVSTLTNYTQLLDNEPQFIDDETFSFLLFINPVIVTCAISIVGIGTNVLNMATFVKLGFAETINISLMTLTVTDLANLTCLLWITLCQNPSLCDLVCDVLDLKQMTYITGGVPRGYLVTVSGYVTSVIACERCFCVLRPLQVRLIFTKRRILAIFVCLYIGCLGPYIPFYITTGLTWVFNPTTNRSVLTQYHKGHLSHVDFVSFGVVTFFNVASYVLVAVFTTVIVLKLASQSRWRAKRTADRNTTQKGATPTVESGKFQSQGDDPDGGSQKKAGMSSRDKHATTTVTLIAAMYIACFFPQTILLLTMALEPRFNQAGPYGNIYWVAWYLAFVGESICSTANIVIYLHTSTRFKDAFVGLFCHNVKSVNEK